MTTERSSKSHVSKAVRTAFDNLALERTAELSATIQRLEHDLAQCQRVEGALRRVLSDERRQIGEELREGIGQDLAGTVLLLGALANRAETGATLDPAQIREIADLVNEVLTRTCALSRGFEPEASSLLRGLRPGE